MSVGTLLMGDLRKRRDADAALDGGKDTKRQRAHCSLFFGKVCSQAFEVPEPHGRVQGS